MNWNYLYGLNKNLWNEEWAVVLVTSLNSASEVCLHLCLSAHLNQDNLVNYCIQ